MGNWAFRVISKAGSAGLLWLRLLSGAAAAVAAAGASGKRSVKP